MIQYFKEILYLLGVKKKSLPFLLGLFLLASFLDLVGISLIGPYISTAISPNIPEGYSLYLIEFLGVPNNQVSILKYLGLVLVFVFFVKAVVSIFINWVTIKFSQDLQIEIRSYLMDSYQKMPYTRYILRSSSEYIVNIQDLTGKYQAIVLAILKSISDILVSIFILSFLAYQNIMALLVLISLLILLIFGYDKIFKNKMTRYGELANVALENMLKGIQQGIEGIKEIRILNKEDYFYNKVKSGAVNLALYQTRQLLITTSPRFLLELFLIFFIVILVVISISIDESFESLLPVLGIFSIASLRLLPAASAISSNLASIRFGRDAVSRLYVDYKEIKEANFEKNLKHEGLSQEFKSLILKDISFSYPNSKMKALDNISMEIYPGKSIGLIGSSGSGKTTLVNFILGLMPQDSGSIVFNDFKLADNLAEWRSKIAYLPQDTFLIDSSLKENVALGVPIINIDENLVLDSLNKAKLEDLKNSLPDGINTLMGERGVRLSGGQKQRVAIARAFYHNREILILDEATSALDNKTEQQIVKEIDELKGHKTLVIIAHRLSTVQKCDYIYKLENGRIISHGKPEDVLG